METHHCKLVLLVVFACYACHVTAKYSPAKTSFSAMYYKNCIDSYSMSCLKLDVISWMDRLDERESYSFIPGISWIKENGLEKENEEVLTEVARAYPNDLESRLNSYLMKRIVSYVKNHALKFDLWSSTSPWEGRGKGGGGGGGGGGGKKGEGYGGIIALGAMMKGTMLCMALAGAAAIAGKALMASLISLVFAAILGAKHMHHQGHHSTYEVISKGHEHDSHSRSVVEPYPGYDYEAYKRSMEGIPIGIPAGLQPGFKPA